MVIKNLQNQQNKSSKVTQKRTKASTEVVDGQGPQVKIPRRGAGPIRESDLASQDGELDYDESGIKKNGGVNNTGSSAPSSDEHESGEMDSGTENAVDP